MALLLLGLAGTASQAAAGELSVAEAVTYDGAEVTPDEVSIDLRHLPMASSKQTPVERPYRPLLRPPVSPKTPPRTVASEKTLSGGGPLAPMPSAINNFAGLSRTDSCTGGNCGSGWPPDPNGDVGPNHYIEAVNTSYAIYNKIGARLAAFTEDQLWSTSGSNPCNGHAQGDPIVLYDALADRWILTHFAFAVDGSGNPVSPFYQCIAASKSSDPVAGGWWLYALRMDPGTTGAPAVGMLNDYAKFGIWTDCLYMAANEFNQLSQPAGAFAGTAFASFNRSDLYSGATVRWSLGFINNASNPFTMIPSNLSGKAALSVPAGTPNYFVSESGLAWAFEVRKFTPGANCGGGGSLSTATSVSQTSYSAIGTNNVPQPNTTIKLDNADDRLMQKVQYRKVGANESLWVVHNVQTAGGIVTPQWAQINVTGGTIATTPVQQQIYAPDTTLFRWMGSLAVDSQGNMALGYSTSNGTSPNFPSIVYSGRLASDPLNTLPQTEVTLAAGAGSQTNNCGGAACNRWGDYTSMSVDPADDCTFWYTNQYYSSQANGTGGNWQTRIGSFKYASCAAAASYTLSVAKSGNGIGTVTSGEATPNINCGVNCSFPYVSGTSVTLTATPAAGSTFTGWSGACSGTGSCVMSMSAGQSVTADFAPASTGTLVTRYRLYSNGTKEHLYTTGVNEYNVLPVCCGWIAEGAIHQVFQDAGSLFGVAAVPYYRLYNQYSHQHHWTTDFNEYNVLGAGGWSKEGVNGFILPTSVTGSVPLYRLYLNAFGGLHLWTTDANEKTTLTTTAGWTSEGVAGYVVPLP